MDFVIVSFLLVAARGAYGIDEYICDTVEVRSYTQLSRLQNCTHVTGNVVMVFNVLDSNPEYSSEEINNLSFPLREITGFLFFHSNPLVKSLGHLFPNLTVIRGQRLFMNYALVLYDTDLEEISLKNLLSIQRGSVRIGGENRRLCLPKIDWSSIIRSGRFYALGKDVAKANCTDQFKQCYSCKSKDLCWSNQFCQRFEEKEHRVIGSNVKCSSLCIGRCVNSTAAGCFVCRDLSENGICVSSCSLNRYLNNETKRCITEEQCITLGRKIYVRNCVQHCPKGYSVTMNYTELSAVDHTCKPCRDKCLRVCSNVPEIRSIAQLEEIGVGCIVINGSLEIKIMEDISNLTAELETFLGDVEEIHGSLKIHRSMPLTSLTFLNKLRIVYGNNKYPNMSVVRIFENQNLQWLFDWRRRDGLQLEVKYGTIQIFNNPMLCETEIVKFGTIVIPSNIIITELVSRNGYQNKCTVDDISTKAEVLSHSEVEIEWSDLAANQTKRRRGYLLQYVTIDANETREAEDNMLFERDSCSSHGWKSVILKSQDINVRPSNDNKTEMFFHKLTNLQQYTFYAFVVQRYNHNSISTKKFNSTISGTSKIVWFQTLMNVPSRVVNFSVQIKTPNAITLKWDVLQKEEKALTTFWIYIYEHAENIKQLDARDYCTNSIKTDELTVINEKSESDDQNLNSSHEKCCQECCQNQNIIRHNMGEFKRSLIEFARNDLVINSEAKRKAMTNLPGFKNLVMLRKDARNFTATDLTVYTAYSFHIYACAEKCSDYELITERTAYDSGFDVVEVMLIDNEFYNNQFRIRFDEPKAKNGAILSYLIEIDKIIDNERFPYRTECITRKQHELSDYEFIADKIEDGVYMFRIRANSLAQTGPFTDWHSFKVIKPPKKSPFALIAISSSIFIAFTLAVFASFYYKHKIMILLRSQNDSNFLVSEMEPTDFSEIQSRYNSIDRLSDILEMDGD